MKLSQNLFWDVDYNKIDWEKSGDWVIVKTIKRGYVEDIRQCRDTTVMRELKERF